MTEEKFMELANREIEGAITPAESSELASYLAADPKRQIEYDELLCTGRALRKVRPVEPPPDLKKNIMSALQSSAPARAVAIESGESWIETIRTRIQASFGYAFAGGALAGAAVLAFIMITQPQWLEFDSNGAVATIALTERLDDFRLIDRLELSLDEVTGSVETRASESETLINITVSSERPLRFLVECEAPAAGFTSFHQTGETTATAQLSKHTVDIAHAGSNAYVIVLENPAGQGSPLRLKIFADSLIFEAALASR